MKNVRIKNILNKIDKATGKLDKWPLWWIGFLLVGIVFIPLTVWGEDCVFPIHDQLDETIMSYVLNAKYLGTGVEVFPEMLGGINVSGMQPAAVLFIPLYKVLSPFRAFLIQYAVVFAAGFFGMYFAVKEMTESSVMAVAMGGCFAMLPLQPIYGLSAVGVPLLVWCFMNLWEEKKVILSFILLLFFGLTTHLVLIGYVVLGGWLLAILWSLLKKHYHKWTYLGFAWLTGIYMIVNRKLFQELLFGRSSYVSHREELVNGAQSFWDTVIDTFFAGNTLHANSLHRHLIAPIILLLIFGGYLYRRMDQKYRKRYTAAVAGILVLVGIALFHGLCKCQPVVELRNKCSGFLRYFQLERFYWLYPAGWFLEFGLCFSLWPKREEKYTKEKDRAFSGGYEVLSSSLIRLPVLLLILLPTLQLIKINSYFYLNVNQYNNGSGITGYISWKSFYAEDLMQELGDAIGKDKESYRVAHLGMSPAPALMYGFYTVDGYSNNYPLEYKHKFREVIEKELEKAPETAIYYDTWGSRCYLFNSESGTSYMYGKNQKTVYQNLELDINALRNLGCNYIFSCGIIENADELGLSLTGYYETYSSYWGVWLYQL